MKTLLITGLLMMSASTFAATCKIDATVLTGTEQCTGFSTKFDVDTPEVCKSIAQGTRANRFFGILEGKEEVLKVTYKFKRTGKEKLKVKERIVFIDTTDICLR